MALACLSLALSGCIDDGPPSVEAFSTQAPRAFSAVVTTIDGSTSGYANLSGPVKIINRAGNEVDAYLYETAWARDGGFGYRQHYLDGDLRRIVSVYGCGFIPVDCETWRQWDWEGEGRLPPDGLAYPNLVAAGDLTSRAVGKEISIPWRDEVDNKVRLVLHVDPRWPHEDPVAYRYVQGRLLPDGPDFQVDEYEDRGPLPEIDAQALPREPLPPLPWEGIMFPGENEDPFGVGATHREIATFAFPDVADGNNTCVESYELQPNRGGEPSNDLLPVSLPSSGQDVTANARVRAVSGTNVTEKHVTVLRNTLNGSVSMTGSSGATGHASLSCLEMSRSPWPQTSMETGMRVASDVVGSDQLAVFTHDIGFMARYANQTPESGLHNVQFDFLPPTNGGAGLGNMLQVRFENSGPLLTLKAIVRDDAEFER